MPHAWRTRADARAQAAPTGAAVLQDFLDTTQRRMQRLSDMYLQKMGEHIRQIGTLWPSDVHRLQQLRQMDQNLTAMEAEIAKAANMTIADVHKVFTDIAQYDYRMQSKVLGQTGRTSMQNNRYLVQKIQAMARETAQTLTNLSNTTVVSAPYRHAVDECVNAVINGVEDYNTAIRRAIREAGAYGLRMRPNGTQAVDYLSGHSRRLDSAVRMNILDGARHVNQTVREAVGDEFGADGIEIDAHMLCAEDHLPYQGMQYSKADFEDIQDSLQRPFGEWNCRHTWAPILLGISPPRYTQQELDEMQRFSTERVEIDGKTHTRYEWSQVQRRCETAIRAEKDTAKLAAAVGDTELQRQCQQRVLALNDRYDRISDAAGLEAEYTRTDVFGFRDYKGGVAAASMPADEPTASAADQLMRDARLLAPNDDKTIAKLTSGDVTQMQQAVGAILDAEGYRKSTWNGIIQVKSASDPMMQKAAGRAEFDRSISIREDYIYDLTTHFHENLHTRSIHRFEYNTKGNRESIYATYLNLEEACVQLATEEFLKAHGVTPRRAGENWVSALCDIHDVLFPNETLLDFSKALIDRGPIENHNYLRTSYWNYLDTNTRRNGNAIRRLENAFSELHLHVEK